MDKNFRIRLSLAFVIVACFSLAAMMRAAGLMLFSSPRLTTALERQFRQEPPRAPRRGLITDRNREPLAVSLEVRSLFANPDKIENKGQVAFLISRFLGVSAAEVRKKLAQDKGFTWIKRHLTEQEEAAARKMLDRNPPLNAVIGLARESKRFYPNQTLAAHLLGFTGMDSNGLEGVEFFYDKELAGESRRGGGTLEGKTLALTIDKALQNTLEMELEDGVKASGGKAGTAIIMDAENGDVLALASYPTYNPNKYHQTPPEFRRNRSVTDGYEPGSTVKPLVTAGAVAAKVVNADTRVFCEYGKMQIGKHVVSEAETKDRWGWLRVEQVIQKSSNIGATKIGFLFGSERTYDWLKRMGIATRTGVDLPGETTGSLSEPKTWSKINLSNISFGQGLAVTPMQMIRAYAALANGGNMVRPRLLREVLNAEGEMVRETPVSVEKGVVDAGTAKAMVQMMSGVATSEGTAPKAAIPGFTVVGKTGTAQKALPGQGYRTGKYVASFIGFVRDVKPNYVVFAMVDEPRFPYFGGEAAGPIFRKIMTASLARAGIAPNAPGASLPLRPLAQAPLPAPGRKTAAVDIVAERTLELKEDAGAFTMPNLIGSSARDVLDLFSRQGMDLRIRGSGAVVEQAPLPGAAFRRGDVVSVRLERGILAQ